MKITEARKRAADGATMDEEALQAVLAAIEPTRLKILFLLGRRKRMCVGDIASGFKVSRPAVSHHLRVLKNSGLVQTEREGQEIYYAVRMNRVIEALRALADAMERCNTCSTAVTSASR